MIISDITIFDNKRRRVFIDGAYTFLLYATEINKYKLEIEMVLTEELYDGLNALQVRRIRERILYMLDSYERSEHDIYLKMYRNGYPEDAIMQAIDILKSFGYIDDTRFATNYAESLRNNRGKSNREIRNKLYEKGVPTEIIDDVMLTYEEDCDSSYELIERALKKKGITREILENYDRNSKNKVYMYLTRRGFESNDIHNYFAQISDDLL